MRRYFFDHLAPEDRPMARRIYLAMVAAYLCAALLLGVAIRLSPPGSGSVVLASEPWPSRGAFSAVAAERPDLKECAVRDLRILTTIGEHGEAQDVAARISRMRSSPWSRRARLAPPATSPKRWRSTKAFRLHLDAPRKGEGAQERGEASAFSICGFSACSRFCGEIGPTSLNAMRPSRSITKVSGTP
jgi:hypothetical protein